MRLIIAAALVALAACGGPPARRDETQSEPAVLIGRYKAASDNARAVTGDVDIERAGLAFASGAILYTRVLEPRRAHELIAEGGDSYAAAALGPSDLIIELRRVTQQTLREGAQGLCGGDAPAYIALAYEARAADVTLLVFAGEEPPGPRATRSRLCATYAYAAPDGARTRQGVVLY
jgi:hypothetical protein